MVERRNFICEQERKGVCLLCVSLCWRERKREGEREREWRKPSSSRSSPSLDPRHLSLHKLRSMGIKVFYERLGEGERGGGAQGDE